ncbi:type II toxin-antitoxin system HicB family antitoxin [Pseudomonas sp. UMAB-40]|uniref:type II toxin-antitoxin system HicB family antitoxin n=1 Tax=Pseudomonas sp. UMAB-40 TaxID=1365407 RepID=UPI001C57DAFA|nr:type II toxin-antitoxin system HicB family antitoxin [Pseudomonas sp. UMAB-40]
MKYKDFTARYEYSQEDGVYVGHLDGISEVVGFHGESLVSLEQAFEVAVDDYLSTCEKLGRSPHKATLSS